METQPYDNGAIPFLRPERRRKREKRPLRYDAAADHRAQRLAAIQEFERAHRAWRERGAKRFEVKEPHLDDFLPDHLKAQPETADTPQPHIPQEEEVEDEDAPIFPQAAAGGDDDSEVPGLGQAPKKAARKAARAKADATTDIDIP